MMMMMYMPNSCSALLFNSLSTDGLKSESAYKKNKPLKFSTTSQSVKTAVVSFLKNITLFLQAL